MNTEIEHPDVDHSAMKLGKKRGVVKDPRTLKLARFTTAPVKIPVRYRSGASIPDDGWGMYLNDQLGDCGIAGMAHADMSWDTHSRNRERPVSDNDVVAGYEAVGGYVPGHPETDNGIYLLDGLNWWHKEGLAGEKIIAFAEVGAAVSEVKTSIVLFGGLYVGFALPITAQRQSEWDIEPDQYGQLTGDAEPGSWGGHCVWVNGFGATYYDLITWGRRMRCSREFFDKYCDERYAVLSPDWLNKKGESSRHLNVDALLDQLRAVTKR